MRKANEKTIESLSLQLNTAKSHAHKVEQQAQHLDKESRSKGESLAQVSV